MCEASRAKARTRLSSSRKLGLPEIGADHQGVDEETHEVFHTRSPGRHGVADRNVVAGTRRFKRAASPA